MNILDLPEEIHYHLLGNLSIWDLVSASCACAAFSSVARADSVWAQTYRHSFHHLPATAWHLLKASDMPWRDIFKDRYVFERDVLRIDKDLTATSQAFDTTDAFWCGSNQNQIPYRVIQSYHWIKKIPAETRAYALECCRLLIGLNSALDNFTVRFCSRFNQHYNHHRLHKTDIAAVP